MDKGQEDMVACQLQRQHRASEKGSLTISHVVGHFKVRQKYIGLLSKILLAAAEREDILSVQRQCNFIVIKDIYYTYNVFTSTGHINVYRINNLNTHHMDDAVTRFVSLFDNVEGDSGPKDLLVSPKLTIVNISAAGKVYIACDSVIDLYAAKLIYESQANKDSFFTRLTYNPDIYAALSCKSKIGGTGNIFSTGSITILGAKSEEIVQQIFEELCVFIQSL